MGQFLSPAPVARLMASMLRCRRREVRILDPGAGVGTLFTAAVAELASRAHPPSRISVLAYEVEESFADSLNRMLESCGETCRTVGIEFRGEIILADFIRSAVDALRGGLFHARSVGEPNCAIVNPPYRKIHSRSEHRLLLRSVGIEASNLYTGFVALALRLLEPGGEFVAITPRSFCNGLYFRPFRDLLLRSASLRRVHLFEARNEAFREDDVLQENVILHAVKSPRKPSTVVVSASAGRAYDAPTQRRMPYSEIVRPEDAHLFIRFVTDPGGRDISKMMSSLSFSLNDLGLEVSTGRVVDFRAREFLRADLGPGSVPLIYPVHLCRGHVRWPRAACRKPNAIRKAPETAALLVPNECYVLVKRFSTKEERRRIVAAVCDPAGIEGPEVAFENHLNYFHRNGRGMSLDLARGLAGFLNSGIVDQYFRQFNGHTQVNATDLRNMRYPSLRALETLGAAVSEVGDSQGEIDRLVWREVFAP